MDQRKIHVLAREVFPKMGLEKPVAIHHHLLAGLAEPLKAESEDKLDKVIAAKMSKSKPWTAIFIHDSDQEIRGKLTKAWCPEKTIELNPVMELAKYIIFHEKGEFTIERQAKFGGDIDFVSYDELEKEYMNGKIHPQDLKISVAREIINIIKPVRKHFETQKARKLMEVFKETGVTR